MDVIIHPYQNKKIEDWSNNDYADFWYYEVGVNTIPYNGVQKNTWIQWTQHPSGNFTQIPIPLEIFNAWKKSDSFKNGIAVICSKVFRGKHKGEWLNGLDFDNIIALKESYPTKSIEEYAKTNLIEQHDNKEKCHTYFYTKDRPLTSKIANADRDEGEKEATKPQIEIKSNGSAIMNCTPSPHEDGSNLKFLGTRNILTVDADAFENQIETICKKYDIPYLSGKNSSKSGLRDVRDIINDKRKMYAGADRQKPLLQYLDSKKIKNPELSIKSMTILAFEFQNDHFEDHYPDSVIHQKVNAAFEFGADITLERLEEEKKKEEETKEKTKEENATSNTIKEFFQNFKDENNEYKYEKSIKECTNKDSITLNVSDLTNSDLEGSDEIHEMLLEQPKQFLKVAARAALEIFKEYDSNTNDKKRIFVHVDEVSRKPTIKKILGNKLIGRMVTVSGMITSVSPKFNVPDFIVYVCPDGHLNTIKQSENEDLRMPVVCENKNCKHRDFEPKSESANFEVYRLIILKSNEDFSLSADDLPVLLSNDLVDMIDVGNNVQVTGFVKTEQVETKSKKNKPVYRNKIVCSSVKKVDEINYHITKQDIENFEKMIEDEDFYKKLVNSITPSIVGLSNVKESILLQIVGSAPRKRNDGTLVRGNIHVGTWGAGGVAKTKFAEWMDLHIPKTKFIHSGGATDKGLLLGLEDNAYGGGKSLHAGAFVYCSGGIVLMDEFIRTGEKIMGDLMTTLETGIAGIAKSGHNAKVKADAALFATGNAFEGEWNENDNLAINLKKTTSELQRFDYHWIILDKFNKKHDEKIAYSIVNDVTYENEEAPHTPEFLYKYTRFIQKFNPILKKEGEVNKHLVDAYLKLRGDDHAKQAGISPRHLNTMIRSSIISARIHQRNEVTIEDADKAISLMTKMVEQQNISISESDTYLSHQFNRAMQIINDGPDEGYSMDNLFFKLRNTGTIEDIALTVAELGDESSQSNNIKWRAVIQKLKMSPRINIISRKPLVMTFRKDVGDMTAFM